MSTNYFLNCDTAERYARARPELNGEFNGRLLEHTGPLDRALDVGCGTGISARALAGVVRQVHAVDPSWAMLSQGIPDAEIAYCSAVAERLPYAPGSFDLVGVGLALHWVGREAFLSEASRVLRPDGWVFIVNTWFGGTMRDVPEFSVWSREGYLQRYPNRQRKDDAVTDENVAHLGFSIRDRWEIQRDVSMSRELLATYLTTQSNVSAELERTGETLASATAWLIAEVEPYFGSAQRVFPFGGSAILLYR
ncbi:MAG: methyltransferase domain-containing protein [Gemmatimonas sp.]|nr:methyltransferase domain-containing protein [Gemmatimonas sp.]